MFICLEDPQYLAVLKLLLRDWEMDEKQLLHDLITTKAIVCPFTT